jgi:hypothetical protein
MDYSLFTERLGMTHNGPAIKGVCIAERMEVDE